MINRNAIQHSSISATVCSSTVSSDAAAVFPVAVAATTISAFAVATVVNIPVISTMVIVVPAAAIAWVAAFCAAGMDYIRFLSHYLPAIGTGMGVCPASDGRKSKPAHATS